jgi:hypothetical protein
MFAGWNEKKHQSRFMIVGELTHTPIHNANDGFENVAQTRDTDFALAWELTARAY